MCAVEDDKILFEHLYIYYRSRARGETRGYKWYDKHVQDLSEGARRTAKYGGINQHPFWRQVCHPGPRVLGDRVHGPCHFDHP